jgi:hypothetical protein
MNLVLGVVTRGREMPVLSSGVVPECLAPETVLFGGRKPDLGSSVFPMTYRNPRLKDSGGSRCIKSASLIV